MGVDTAIMECRLFLIKLLTWFIPNVKRAAFQLEVFPGKGIVKVESVMQRLYEIGYQGVVQPEHLGPPNEAELLPAATKYLQDLT